MPYIMERKAQLACSIATWEAMREGVEFSHYNAIVMKVVKKGAL